MDVKDTIHHHTVHKCPFSLQKQFFGEMLLLELHLHIPASKAVKHIFTVKIVDKWKY